MAILIRIVKRLLRLTAYAVLAAVVLLVIGVLVVGLTPFGARFAADQVSQLASTPDRVITLGTPSGLLTGRLRLDQVTVADSQGTFAEVRDIAVDWSPLSLLGGTFKVDLVSAGSVSIVRAPIVTQTPPPAEDGGGSSLPVAIDITRLSLPDITLGSALAGRDFALAADGSLHADGAGITTQFSANRKDLPEAKARAEIAFVPSENRLALDADIAEPQGGLIAGLLRLPNSPAIALKVNGTGPLSDWAGKLAASLDGQPVLNVDARHQQSTGGAHRIAVKGGGTFDSLLPPSFRPLFAGSTEIDVAASFDDTGRLSIESGNIATGNLLLAASGELNPNGDNSLKANLIGAAGPIDFRWPLADGEARLLISGIDLSLTGQAAAAKLDLSAAVEQVDLPQGRLGQLRLDAKSNALNLTERSGTIQTRFSVAETAFVSPDIDRAVEGPLTITAPLTVSPDAIAFDAIALESPSIGGTLTGRYTLADKTLATAFRLFAVPSVLPDALAAKFETTIAAEGNVSATIGGRTEVSGLTLKSGTIEASGNVALDGETLTADLTGRLPDLGKLVADARGIVDFSVSADGPLSAMAFKANLSASEAALGERALTDLSVSAEGKADPASPQVTVKASGALGGQTINVDADLLSENGATRIPKLLAQVGANRIEGALVLSPTFEPDGRLTLDLPDIGLLAALAGQEAQGDLKGSAMITTQDGRIQAVVNASGSGISRDDLRIANPVIDLTIDDVKALSARGTVRADEIASGGHTVAQPQLAFTQQAGKTGFDLKANYDEAPLLAAGSLQSVDGAITIAIDALSAAPRKVPLELDRTAAITIANGTVTLPGLAIRVGDGLVTLSGTVGERLALTADIANIPATLANTFVPAIVAKGALSGTANISGLAATPVVSADLRAALQSVEMSEGRFSDLQFTAKTTEFDIATLSGTVETRLDVAGLEFVSTDLNRAVQGPLAIAAPIVVSAGSIGFDGSTIESPVISGRLDGGYALATQTVLSHLAFTIQPAALPEAAATKFDAPITLESDLSSIIGGKTELSNLKIASSGTLQADGAVTFEKGLLAVDLKGALPEIGKLLADAKGAAQFRATIQGEPSALAIDATMEAAKAELAGRTLTDLSLNAKGVADRSAPQAVLKATGTLDGQKLAVDADLISENGITRLPKLLATVGRNRLEGALAFSPSFAPSGQLTFDIPDLSLFAALAGQRAEGDLKGAITLSTNAGIMQAKISASGSGIRRDDLSIVKPVVDLTVDDLAALSANGTVRAEEIRSGANRIQALALAITQSGGKTGFDLKAQYDGAPLLTSGSIQSAGGAMTVALNRFEAAPKRLPLKLESPTTIRIAGGNVTLSKLGIRAGNGTITVNGGAGEQLQIDAKISNLPASLANTFVPSIAAEGTISGTVAVRGSTAAPAVDYQLAWANAAVAQTKSAGVGAFDIKANGRFADNTLRIDTSLSGGGLSLSGGGTVGVTGNQPLALAFEGTLPFSVAAAQLASQGLSLEGQAKVNLRIAGTAASPDIAGTITAAGATLVDVRRNIALNNLALNVSLDRDRATINRLSGQLAQGGTVSATGTIGFAGGSGFPADLAIKLDKAAYVDGTLLATVIDGNLTLKGPVLTAPVLGGELRLGKTSITVPEKLPASLSEINVKHKNAPRDVQKQAQTIKKDEGGSGTQSTIGLDLTISAPSRIFVRGRGIDAELGGSLTVRGTATDPVVSGGFEMRRGRLNILNKRLDFTSGEISFGGSLTPTLNLEATNTTGSTAITITVAGVANDPSITFSSSPALPQDEILAQLIFGQSMSKLSALQIAQLADAASQLAGGRSTSLFQALRSNLGVDDLDISTDEKGEARVSAGKYLNSRTYIELQGGGESGGKAIINLDVGRGVKLRGEAGGNGEGAAGIFYEKEY
ncbi:translocation/assembly module TamB domain-containing protein [Rhizobium sp. LjRoot30]|uniref:translocation/assembly module TamB domain-containing protein n=1 Tax=Rhizobium sp. LjRoot30 TaxID=3342320 RepID=UPI003ECC58BF